MRLIGVIEAKQTESAGTERNDRLIALKSRRHEEIRSVRQLSRQLLDEIEHFFASYNAIKGKKFTPLGRFGPARALRLVRRAVKAKEKKSAHEAA